MKRVPSEFAELLTPRGRRVLDGRVPALNGPLADPRTRFLALTGLVDPWKAERLRASLQAHLAPHLEEMARPIPPQTLSEMTENYGELLPKTGRVLTAYMDSRRDPAFRAAEEMGLVALLRSESFGRFAALLAGRGLQKKWGIQVLCYRPGDYAGPHNDHHPEDEEARSGYLDVHLSLSTREVAHQLLVYARRGHFTEVVKVSALGTITAYRLPFWHYTTPLVAKRGAEEQARRWVLLGTFLFT